MGDLAYFSPAGESSASPAGKRSVRRWPAICAPGAFVCQCPGGSSMVGGKSDGRSARRRIFPSARAVRSITNSCRCTRVMVASGQAFGNRGRIWLAWAGMSDAFGVVPRPSPADWDRLRETVCHPSGVN